MMPPNRGMPRTTYADILTVIETRLLMLGVDPGERLKDAQAEILEKLLGTAENTIGRMDDEDFRTFWEAR